jgi:high-affinity nickel-transport protein
VVAFAVGGIEALGLMAEQFHLKGRFWNFVSRLNDNFGTLDYFIIGLFPSVGSSPLRSTSGVSLTVSK